MGDGDGNLSLAATTPELAGNPGAPSVGDFDGDGALDVALTVEAAEENLVVHFGNGTGGVSLPPHPFDCAGDSGQVGTGDLDADGFDDLVAACNDANKIVVIFGDEDRGLSRSLVLAATQPKTAAIADVSGDGALDLLVTCETNNAVLTYRGLGDGTFLEPVACTGGDEAGFIRVADVDGDGFSDVVALDHRAESMTITLGSPRIFRTTAGSVTVAMIFIRLGHLGHFKMSGVSTSA